MSEKPLLEPRAQEYCHKAGMVLGKQLGFGVHGIVFATASQVEGGRRAIKVHEHEDDYCRERDVYLRLREHEINEILGCAVPELTGHDNNLLIIEMTIVTRPFILDFGGAFLDRAPDFPEEVMAEWRAEKAEQFGKRWSDAEAILRYLADYGIHVVDVNPNNISWPD